MINYQVTIDKERDCFTVKGPFEENAVPISIDRDHPKRKEFIDLFLHKEDIESGIAYLQCISVDKDLRINEALFIAGLNNCMKCFKYSKSRSKLDKNSVFCDNAQLLSNFVEFEIMRDKHFDHDESGMTQATAFLLVSQAEDHTFGGPPSVVWNKSRIDYYLAGQRLQEIMQVILRFICKEIDTVGIAIEGSYKNESKEDLLKRAAAQIFLASPGSTRR